MVAPSGGRVALRNIERELTPTDLNNNPAALKMVLDRLDKAEEDCGRLQGYEERFHEADKKAAVLQQKIDSLVGFDILHSMLLGVGGIMIGVGQGILNATPWPAWVIMSLGVIAIGSGALARFRPKKKS
jgi:hypothetical protein